MAGIGLLNDDSVSLTFKTSPSRFGVDLPNPGQRISWQPALASTLLYY